MPDSLVPYTDLERMADVVVRAGLFPGIKTVQQALTLFLVAQAEGLHPMTATMRYNIIQNRPAMKAEAMLASFMERGGTVDWVEYTDAAVTGVFTSAGVPKGVTVRWTMEDARRAGVTMNQTWTKYPRQMLKARVASDGVRMADPSVNSGRYTPEEVSEFDKPHTVAIEAEIVPENNEELAEAERYAAAARAKSAESVLKYVVPRCDNCGQECGIYTSTQSLHLGRRYHQCNDAHSEIERMVAEEGYTVQKAAASMSLHYRKWIDPPIRKTAADGAAPKVELRSEPPPPEEPAPSIFDPKQIAADVAARLSMERK